MNSFKQKYVCYQKAQKQATALLWMLCLLFGVAAGIPVFWYGLSYDGDNLLWTLFVRICVFALVGVILFLVSAVIFALLERKIMRCFYKQQTKKEL